MPVLVTISQAKAQLSRLIQQVEEGETVILRRGKHPVAILIPYRRRKTPRRPGGWEGRVWIAPDFDEPDEGIQALFEGGSPEPAP